MSYMLKKTGKIKQPPAISASEFDRKFDDGEDVSQYLDFKKAKANYPL